MFWLALFMGLWVPGTASAGALTQTFSAGGAGFAIVELVLIAAFGALCYYIASALNQGQIGSMIKLVTAFSCISVVVSVVWKAIAAVGKAFGVDL